MCISKRLSARNSKSNSLPLLFISIAFIFTIAGNVYSQEVNPDRNALGDQFMEVRLISM